MGIIGKHREACLGVLSGDDPRVASALFVGEGVYDIIYFRILGSIDLPVKRRRCFLDLILSSGIPLMEGDLRPLFLGF